MAANNDVFDVTRPGRPPIQLRPVGGGGEGRDETPLLNRHHFGLITYPGLKEREGKRKHYGRPMWGSIPRPWD